MIRVNPCEKTTELEAFTGVVGENLIYMAAREEDKLIGAGVATPTGEILTVEGDDAAVKLIIRSFINYFDRRGICEIISKNHELYIELEEIGFSKRDEIMTIDTNVFFGNNC